MQIAIKTTHAAYTTISQPQPAYKSGVNDRDGSTRVDERLHLDVRRDRIEIPLTLFSKCIAVADAYLDQRQSI